MTKKDSGLVFHFHVLNLFKCWSNLGLTNIKISIIFLNNQKIEKPAHIVLICRILTTQVDKQGLDTFEQKMHVSGVISENSN